MSPAAPAPRRQDDLQPRSGRWRRRILVGLGLLAVAVAVLVAEPDRTLVTPGAVAASAATEEVREQVLTRWRHAVRAADAFLASDFNRSLPRGRLTLDDDGMVFETEGARLPVDVWESALGRVAVLSGAVAQEAPGGFRVGRQGRSPRTDGGDGPVTVIDHSWFRSSNGFLRPVEHVARTLLHELGHGVHRVGNFGVLTSLGNYGEIVFRGRSWAERSFERAPQAVSHEFTHWWLAGDRHELTDEAFARPASTETLDEHLRETGRTCEHGPAPEWFLSW